MNQHAKFLERLVQSSAAVFAVARHQHAKGHSVEIPAVSLAPTAADAPAHIDGGDLFIVIRKRIEVKHRDIDFTGPGDWPYPDVLVSNVAAVDRAAGKVMAYVSVSKNMQYAAIVYQSTAPHWTVVECRASNTGNIERNYACPLQHVVFTALNQPPPPQTAAEAIDSGRQFEFITGETA